MTSKEARDRTIRLELPVEVAEELDEWLTGLQVGIEAWRFLGPLERAVNEALEDVDA